MSDINIEKFTDIGKMDASVKEVLGAVVGLAKTCGNNPYTDDTIRIICDTLMMAQNMCDAFGKVGKSIDADEQKCIDVDCSGTDAPQLVERLHKEKYKVSPGCAVCQSRCGNTDDYDIALILDEEPEKLRIKEELIYNTFKLARAAHENNALYADDGYRLVLLGALTVLSYEMSTKGLENALEQVKNWK